MKASEIQTGKFYSIHHYTNGLIVVRVDKIFDRVGYRRRKSTTYTCTSMKTHRQIVVKSAAKFRYEVVWVPKHGNPPGHPYVFGQWYNVAHAELVKGYPKSDSSVLPKNPDCLPESMEDIYSNDNTPEGLEAAAKEEYETHGPKSTPEVVEEPPNISVYKAGDPIIAVAKFPAAFALLPGETEVYSLRGFSAIHELKQRYADRGHFPEISVYNKAL